MASGRKRLFVDGYNVLHAWKRLGVGSKLDAAVARQEIVDAVRSIVDVEDVEATVVFDGRESFKQVEATGSDGSIQVLFAPAGLTADGAIERLVAEHAKTHPCIVVTADRMERETVTASGSDCITPQELTRWVERCRQRARRRPAGHPKFGNKLPL